MKQNNPKKGLIYLRYLFPVISQILLTIFMSIPCIRFSLDGEKKAAISCMELLKNSWDNARVYLFSANTEQTNDGLLFYKSVFTVVIITVLLFIIPLAVNIFTAISGYMAFSENRLEKDRKKVRNLYTTLIPNRVLLCAVGILTIPLSLLPEMIVYLYTHVLLYAVKVEHTIFVAPWMLALLFFVLSCVFTAIAKKCETASKTNMFSKRSRSDIIHSGEGSDNTKLYRFEDSENEEEKIQNYFNKN